MLRQVVGSVSDVGPEAVGQKTQYMRYCEGERTIESTFTYR